MTILNLHRVAPDDGSSYRPLSPHLFEKLLVFLGEHFDLTTFGGLRNRRASARSNVILSFDDGYLDFFEVAMPILARHGVSCNQNVIPGCMESGLPPLNVIAQDFIGRAPLAKVRALRIPGFGEVPGRRCSHRMSAYLKNRPQREQDQLAAVLLPQFFGWEGFEPTRMMTEQHVMEAAKHHEIGAHSYFHASMQYETDAYLDADLIRCKTYFSEVLGLPMDIYAFPNGSCTRAQVEIVKKHGVSHVLLVGEEFASGSVRELKRFTFDAAGEPEMRFKALGGYRAVLA